MYRPQNKHLLPPWKPKYSEEDRQLMLDMLTKGVPDPDIYALMAKKYPEVKDPRTIFRWIDSLKDTH